MIQTCTAEYRAGAGFPDMPHCGRVFDDVDRSTICPHDELGRPLIVGGEPDLFNQDSRPTFPTLKSAHLSDDGLYRYELIRTWSDPASFLAAGADRERLLTFVMLNPSTADASIDDPTVVRCMSFARREGLDGIRVVNLYAWRSSSPAAMFAAEEVDGHDIIGPNNTYWIRRALGLAADLGTPVVAAWGVHGRPDRVTSIIRDATDRGVQLQALKVTKAGAPGHPLYVRGDAPLVPWEPR